MQRLHQDDLSGHLIETGGWTHLNLAALAPFDAIIRTGPQRRIVRRVGDALHADRESQETLEKIRREIGSQKFSAQYQQEPIPLDGNYIKREWFKTYSKLPVEKLADQVVQSWDFASSVGEYNDFSVCTTWRRHGVDFYLEHVFRARLEYPDLRRKIRSLAREFSPNIILIEKAGLGIALLQELENPPLVGFVRPIGIVPRGDKRDRLIAQSARIESGQVHLPAEAPWLVDFLQELLAFPHSRHDDQVDSVSQFLYWATNPWFEESIEVGLPIFGGSTD
jgi:predicted phage terminase large subunit-like protein